MGTCLPVIGTATPYIHDGTVSYFWDLMLA